MKSVNRFEANLLRILYAILGKSSMPSVRPLLENQFPGTAPNCLSPTAIELIEQAIRKGCISKLVRLGGWRSEAFLRNNRRRKGPLWERSQPANLGLTFSPVTLELLIWLTQSKVDAPQSRWRVAKNVEPTVGDQFFLYLVFQALEKSSLEGALAKNRLVAKNGLIRLAYPERFGKAKAKIEFQTWTQSVGAAILECLQDELFDQWLAAEQRKRKIFDCVAMRRLGETQTAILGSFFTELQQAGRQDLARFVLHLLYELVSDHSQAKDWTGHLDLKGVRLAERESSYRGALALLHLFERWSEQNEAFAGETYIDENYEASQLWKSHWEHYLGDQVTSHCRRIIAETSF